MVKQFLPQDRLASVQQAIDAAEMLYNITALPIDAVTLYFDLRRVYTGCWIICMEPVEKAGVNPKQMFWLDRDGSITQIAHVNEIDEIIGLSAAYGYMEAYVRDRFGHMTGTKDTWPLIQQGKYNMAFAGKRGAYRRGLSK